MAWNPYTDYQNRGFIRILTTLFPEQTKTLPRILVWGLIFLIELTAFAFCVMQLGLLDWCRNLNTTTMVFGFFLIAFLAVFRLQGWIWGAVTRAFRQIKS